MWVYDMDDITIVKLTVLQLTPCYNTPRSPPNNILNNKDKWREKKRTIENSCFLPLPGSVRASGVWIRWPCRRLRLETLRTKQHHGIKVLRFPLTVIKTILLQALKAVGVVYQWSGHPWEVLIPADLWIVCPINMGPLSPKSICHPLPKSISVHEWEKQWWQTI